MQNETEYKQRFSRIVADYQGLIFSVAYAICGNSSDAWDLTQDVFVKAWQTENFLHKDFKQKAWLVKVARNEALKRKRSFKTRLNYLLRYCGFEDSTETSEIEERLMRSEQVAKLKTLLQTFEEDEIEIITLRFSAEMSYKEIAETMEIKIGTVMSRLARLKKKLGQSFEEEEI